MVFILSDDEVRSRLTATDAVRWMGEAIDAHHRGDLVAPPRTQAELGEGRVVFTAGHLRGAWFGYRSYATLPSPAGDQLVVVHDEGTGAVRAIAVGREIGPRRTGAIGAVAADALAPPTATVAAIIGAGAQALTQLWALSAIRNLNEVRIFSRDRVRRDAFVAEAETLTTVPCRSASSAQSAVDGADIVILATTSTSPVIETAWLAAGAYVSSLGPKQLGLAEFDADLVAQAAMIVTDSLAQVDAYGPPSVLATTPQRERLASLGAVRAGEVARPDSERITLFLSVGLAGTEVYLLDRLTASINH